ncbi:MAG: disulfide bond formation protein B [Alphaproteobacteria bacterium]|nr:disulfide bond formation protein B [Alphaproteobacteria bacterium]
MVFGLRPWWPVLTLLASGAMLATAILYFQGIQGLQPCALCLKQREWHRGVVAISVLALVVMRVRPAWTSWAIMAIGLVLLGSAAMAGYHVAVEHHWVVAQCDVGGAVNPADLSLDNLGQDLHPPRCDEIAWSMFGISMAGYNAIVSLLLALASFYVALAGKREQ